MTMIDVSSSSCSPISSPFQTINPLIRPPSSSNPPSPPLESSSLFTSSDPGSSSSATDDSLHYSSYPPSPAHQADLSFLEPPRHFTYPASPLIPSHVPPPPFSALLPPPPQDSTFIRHLHDQNFACPQPPYHHQWNSLPSVPRYYQSPHSLAIHQNPSAFYTPSLLPSAPVSPFFHSPPQEFLAYSKEFNTFESFPIPHYNHIIPRPSNNLVPYTPSPPPSPSLASTATLDQIKEENPTKLPPIPRSKKKRYPKPSSGPQRICVECSTSSTPEWRSGPNGERNFCNRCGLRWRKAERSKKIALSHVLGVKSPDRIEIGTEMSTGKANQFQPVRVKVENCL